MPFWGVLCMVLTYLGLIAGWAFQGEEDDTRTAPSIGASSSVATGASSSSALPPPQASKSMIGSPLLEATSTPSGPARIARTTST